MVAISKTFVGVSSTNMHLSKSSIKPSEANIVYIG